MKKRLTAVFLCLSLILTLLPATAFAASTTDTGTSSPAIYVGGAELTGSAGNPDYATTDYGGTVITEGATAANYNVKWDGETLTLRNAVIIAADNQDLLSYVKHLLPFCWRAKTPLIMIILLPALWFFQMTPSMPLLLSPYPEKAVSLSPPLISVYMFLETFSFRAVQSLRQPLQMKII